MNHQPTILLIGGYGVVGKQLATLLQQYHPQVHIIIGGRHLATANEFASTLSNASTISFDIDAPELPDDIQPQLVVTLANDADNRVLDFAIEKQIAYLDITRWTDRLKTAVVYTHSAGPLHSPVVFSSGWMAGLVANVIINHTQKFQQLDNIDIDILYSMQDQAGINSVAYMDRMLIPFEITRNGHCISCQPFTDAKLVNFTEKKRFWVYRFDTPDQLTLPLFTQAKTVSTRIGFNKNSANWFLYTLIHSGFWHLISGKRCKGLRQKLLYSPGKGDEHIILITITGRDATNRHLKSTMSLTDPMGQSHLTAIGAFNQINHILTHKLANQVYFGETLANTDSVIKILKKEGVRIDF